MASRFYAYFLRKYDDYNLTRFVNVLRILAALPPVFLQMLLPAQIALLSVPALIGAYSIFDVVVYSGTAFGWEAFGGLAVPLGACICAALVFIFRNPMHALLALLGVFFSTVLMYLTAGIAFVGLVFLIVYVGAVAVLFLFVIMLLNVKSLTSNDKVVQHASQIIAIVAVLLLLQQLHCHTAGAMNRSLSDDFTRAAMVEPTSGNAVFTYVRFQAMDINALTSLYTLHAVLFLVITCVLLSALMGAIILATVTTERATSIYDVRDYSAVSTKYVKTVCAATGLLIIIFVPELFSSLDFFDTDITPIPMSYHHYRLNEEKLVMPNYKQMRFRRSRGLRVDVRYYALRRPRRVKAKFSASRWCTRRGLVYRKYFYRGRLRALVSNYFPNAPIRRVLRRPRVFRAYASAALVPVLLKIRSQFGDQSTIVRRRWLWRWRRDRATSLFRLDRGVRVNDLSAGVRGGPLVVPGRIRRVLRWFRPRFVSFCVRCVRPHWRRLIRAVTSAHVRRMGSRRRSLFTWFGWWLYENQSIRQYPRVSCPPAYPARAFFFKVLRLPRLRFRWSPIRYLRFQYRTRVSPRVYYFSWRVRSFCAFFFFYLAIIPVLSGLTHLFVEEYTVIWEQLGRVYDGLHNDERYRIQTIAPDSVLAHVVTTLLMPVACVLVWTGHQGLYIAVLSALMAYDAVQTHGGELSEIEFHESRCEYWRKESWAHVERDLIRQAAAALVRARQHPDKGCSDSASYPYWAYVLQGELPPWAMEYVFRMLDVYQEYAYYVRQTQVYRCLSAWVRSLPPAVNKKYPFILDWYLAARQAVIEAAYSLWGFWCKELWTPISTGFGSIKCYPRWIFEYTAFYYNPYGMTAVFYAVITAFLLYSASSLLLRVNWQRMYYKTPIRRPRLFIHIFMMLFSLYALVLFYIQYAYPVNGIVSFLPRSIDLYATYNQTYCPEEAFREAWFGFKRFWVVVPGIYTIVYFLNTFAFIEYAEYYRPRIWLNDYRPVTLRSYFNRSANWHQDFEADDQELFAEELLPFSSANAACAGTVTAADEEAYADYREEQAKLLHFNIVMHTYIPKYYDTHTQPVFQKDTLYPGAFFSDKHHENAFHSA